MILLLPNHPPEHSPISKYVASNCTPMSQCERASLVTKLAWMTLSVNASVANGSKSGKAQQKGVERESVSGMESMLADSIVGMKMACV